jgi:tRNA-specific 2-thiouridylase
MTPDGNDSKRVVVAMSGGVDSSVAAALLVEQGYDVVGLMLRLWAEPGGAANRCCTPDAVADARRVADALAIPFYVRDYKDLFKHTVVDFFIEGYAQGVTPNPCVVCNRDIRFDRFPTKDQSYMLYTMNQERLARVLFPVGEYSKSEIRHFAQSRNLPVFNRPDSQDLCFLGQGDYRAFLRRHAPQVIQPGSIRNRRGDILGKHQGLAFYTIGQRKGLGLSSPQAMYVIDKDLETNTLTVGPMEDLGRFGLIARQTTYTAGQPPESLVPVTAKIRYRAKAVDAALEPLPGARARLHFEHPLRDITPGQAVVFFNGEQVLGGGVIEQSIIS